jgi:hypothetical protein
LAHVLVGEPASTSPEHALSICDGRMLAQQLCGERAVDLAPLPQRLAVELGDDSATPARNTASA